MLLAKRAVLLTARYNSRFVACNARGLVVQPYGFIRQQQQQRHQKEPQQPSQFEKLNQQFKSDLEKNKQVQTQAANQQLDTTVVKKSLKQKIIDEVKHYMTGFKLIWMDTKISTKYVKKMMKGQQLSRREREQLIRTSSDIFRLVPFSIFLIVPFMEFLLPFYLKFFPSMLPSTFQTKKHKESRVIANLKVKLDVAKFLQESLNEIASQAKDKKHSEEAEKFAKFFDEVRASGAGATNEDILRYSKLFEDEITLDSMSRQQLVACCKLLELQPYGTNAYLRYQLEKRLDSLKEDDEEIEREGVESLTASELQAACRARGMRALGVPVERLRDQLKQWLDLSLNERIPASLLLLSRAMFVPENIPTSEQLKVTLQSLPELAGTEVECNIAETEGVVVNETMLEFIEQEEEEIKREQEQEKAGTFGPGEVNTNETGAKTDLDEAIKKSEKRQ